MNHHGNEKHFKKDKIKLTLTCYGIHLHKHLHKQHIDY